MFNIAFDDSLERDASAPRAARFTFWGNLASTQREAEYRQRLFPHARRQANLIGWLTLLPTLLFALSDYQLFGFGPTFFVLAAVRLAAVAATLAALVLLRRISSMEIMERGLLLWGLLQVSVLLFVNFTRPPGYLSHAVWDVLVVVLTYVALPIRLSYQTVPAVLMSIGNIAIVLLVKSPAQEMTTTVVIVANVFANLLGFIISHGLQCWRRRQFVTLQEERQLRLALEIALAEIRTLRGIVPICAYCKRIRDEEGAWHQVETYIRDRTHADFTHGICPQCSTEVLAEAQMPR
ncbi:MAG: hypothetical protein FJ271_28345 [Planctomycetes bacterium]|nr:hypothetical protein [Planctomycetota bacterium]